MKGKIGFEVEAPRFDWYSCTFHDSARRVVRKLASHMSDTSPVEVPGQYRFRTGHELRFGGTRSAVVYSNGPDEHPHVVASGLDAETLAQWARSADAPAHTVARADVCVDSDSPAAWETMLWGLRDLLSPTVKAVMMVPDRADDGATYYVGSPTSEVRARLYEKGKQMQSVERPDWVRYEVQYRPQKTRKTWAATAEREDILHASRWSRRFAETVLDIAGHAPPARQERVADLERALDACAAQYGRRMHEWLGLNGGDLEGLALTLLERANVS